MTRSERVLAFISRYCLTPEGQHVGKPFELAPFQVDYLKAIYDNPHGTRRAYLSLGRKNGKTSLCAAILLAHLVGPEAKLNSQIVSGARSREQAGVLHALASKMVTLSPDLSKICRVIPSGKRIIGLPMNVEYRALAAEGSTAMGLSPILAILDEAGQVKGPYDEFFEAITTAQGAHADPLLMAISTQSPTDADWFSIVLDDAERSADPRIVSHVYRAPEDCDLEDEAAWKLSNPGLGLFRSLDDVREQARQAKRMPSAENGFRNLVLNQRVNMVSAFVSASVWKSCNGAPHEFDGAPVWAGLDLSATTDLTAFVMVQRSGETWGVRPFFWIPAESISEASRRDKAPYDLWVRQGLLRTTPGKVIDYEFVARDLGLITAGFNIAAVAFDRWRMDRLKAELARAEVELPLVEFGQGYRSMTPALDSLESALLQGQIAHGAHPVLAMCAAGAVAVSDAAGNRKLEKNKSTARIDGLVGLTMAMGAAMGKEEATPYSPWDDPAFSLAAA